MHPARRQRHSQSVGWGMWVEGTKVRLGVSPHGRTQSRRSPPQPQPGCWAGVGEVWGYCVEGKLERDQKDRYLLVEVIVLPSVLPCSSAQAVQREGVTAVAHYIFCFICKPQLVPIPLELEKRTDTKEQ